MLHVFAVALDGRAEERGSVAVAADEFGCRREGEIHQVVKDENLAVAIGPGADADRGNGEGCGNGAAASRGMPSRTMAPAPARPARRRRPGAAAQPRCAGLHAIAAHAMHALRREAEMADDGNLGFNSARTNSTRGPSILTASAPASLTKRTALATPSATAVIAAEGHVGHHQGAAHGRGARRACGAASRPP
jgi:hypothetical protein